MEQLKKRPLSLTCYILWFIHQKPENTDLAFTTNPFSYIFRYENKYHITGKNFWQFNKHIRWFKTNLVLIFEKHRWEEIKLRFSNFRNLNTNKPTDTYDTYLTLKLKKDNLAYTEPIDDVIIQIPSPNHPLPKRYRPYNGGLNFGFFKKNQMVCFAAAPHILTDFPFSFAIIRGVETEFLKRRQGYALNTVGLLCKELFSRYHLNNIFLWVEERNLAARNLYQKIGFSEEIKFALTYCDLKE
ncbi:MAG: GNAT family N-acetyltransferase [Candidatus Thorarchaeota archaeon]